MIPKIEFRYSPMYDSQHRLNPRVAESLKKRDKNYPTVLETINFKKDLEKIWEKEGDKILRKISEFTEIEWNEKGIICYIISAGAQMSDPLTVRVYENIEDGFDTLTHELIHCIFRFFKKKKGVEWENYLKSKYSDLSQITINHIFLHAIHKKIYLNLFNKDRLKKDIEINGKDPDYAKSWEIVEKEGYENIIKKFKELTK